MATYISARSLVANESDGFVDIILTLSAATPGGVTVTYAASYVTADFNDYTDVGGTLTFGAAETSKTLRVNLTNDVTTEGHVSIYFLIYNGVNAVVGYSNFIVNIAPNDQQAKERPDTRWVDVRAAAVLARLAMDHGHLQPSIFYPLDLQAELACQPRCRRSGFVHA